MFEISYAEDGSIVCRGRLDAARSADAQAFLDEVTESATVDFAALEYISSAGLGVLLKTQKRLATSGASLKITNLNNHIYDIFRYSGFTSIFDIEPSQS